MVAHAVRAASQAGRIANSPLSAAKTQSSPPTTTEPMRDVTVT